MAALASEGSGRITLTDEYVHAALEELLAEGGVLTRVMLAGTRRRRAATRHRVAACKPRRADRPAASQGEISRLAGRCSGGAKKTPLGV